jgi:hypothetical protein
MRSLPDCASIIFVILVSDVDAVGYLSRNNHRQMTVFLAFASPEMAGAASFHGDLELNLAVLKKALEFTPVQLTIDHSGSMRILISNLKNILGKINANVYEFLIFQNFCGIHIAALFNLETGAVYPTSVSFFSEVSKPDLAASPQFLLLFCRFII